MTCRYLLAQSLFFAGTLSMLGCILAACAFG